MVTLTIDGRAASITGGHHHSGAADPADHHADLTIMEESSEFVERLTKPGSGGAAPVYLLLPRLGAVCPH